MAVDKITELHEKRVELAVEMKDLAKRQDAWNAEDSAKWDDLNGLYDTVMDEIGELERALEIRTKLEEVENFDDRIKHRRRTERGDRRDRRAGLVTSEERALALQAWLRHANHLPVTPIQEQAAHECRLDFTAPQFDARLPGFGSSPSGYQVWNARGRDSWDEYDKWQKRADAYMTVGTDADGGYTVPEGFMAELEKTMVAFGGPRKVGRVIQTATGNTMPWPTVDDTGNSGALLAEATTVGDAVNPTVAVITFAAYKFSSTAVLVSAELMQDSAFNVASTIAQLLGERLGRGEAAYLTTGTGSSQPQGIVTGASAGKTFAATGAITALELIDLQDSLDPAYESFPSIGWMMKKSTLTLVRKLVDSNGQFMWQPGLRLGEPDLLLGQPYTICQNMDAAGASKKTVLYGAFEKFVIRDAGGLRFYRLEERYRDLDLTGFVAFKRLDSHVINSAAIHYGVQAAS